MENIEATSKFESKFVIANAESNSYYAFTCETNDFIGFIVKDYSDGDIVVRGLSAEEGVDDEEFRVMGRCFNEYYPIDEEIRLWTNDASPLGDWIKDAVKEEYARLCAVNAERSKSNVQDFAPLPKVDSSEVNAVINEMISKVDVKKFKAFASMSCNRDWDEFKRIFISKGATDKYLRTWALNKYRIYLAFGRKLKIETDYEANRSVEDFLSEFRSLGMKYECYAPTLHFITDHASYSDLAENNVRLDAYGRRILPTIGSKGKVTTLCHALFNDDKFDADLGYIYHDNKLHRKLAISIDPIDFLTMSENQHGWESCHNLHGGCYGSGGFSYMTDSATAIAYMYNGNMDYRYSIGGIESKWNSKEWRQCVYISNDSGSAVFSRQYPRYNDEVGKAVRKLYEDTIAPDATWKLRNNDFPCRYDEGSSMLYHDCNEGYDFKSIRLRPGDNSTMCVGGPVFCLDCGEEIDSMEQDSRIICSDCFEEAHNGSTSQRDGDVAFAV